MSLSSGYHPQTTILRSLLSLLPQGLCHSCWTRVPSTLWIRSWNRRGCLEYLIDWEGYGPEERIPREDILEPALLTSFHREYPHHPAHLKEIPSLCHYKNINYHLLHAKSFWSRQVGGYFLLDYSVTYLLSCFVLCCTCLMFECVRKVVDSLVCHKQSKHISTGFAKFSR